MNISRINNQNNFNGLSSFLKIKPSSRNYIVKNPGFKKPSVETVVVLPDGTIEKGKLAKVRQWLDERVESVLLFLAH